MFSYLAIVCVSLITSLTAYFLSVRVIESEIAKAHHGSLQQVQALADGMLDDLKAVYIQVGFDAGIQFLMSLEGPLTPERLLEATRTVSVLKRCKVGSPIVKEIYLHMERSRLVLTTEGRYSMDTFLESVFPYGRERFAEWTGGTMEGISLFPADARTNAAVYVVPLPIGNATGYLGRLIVVLDQERILKTLDDLRWMEESRMLILDGAGRVLSHNGAGLPPSITYGSLDQDTAIDRRADLVVSRVPSRVCDWKYVSLIPAGVFYRKARDVKNAIVLCLLACLAAGIGISFFFSKKYADPVEKLLRFIQDDMKKVKAEGDDEWHFIQGILDDALRQRTEFQESRSRQAVQLRDGFLEAVAGGRLDDGAIEEMKGLHGVPLDPSALYMALSVSVEDAGPITSHEESVDRIEEGLDAAAQILLRTLGELIQGRYGLIAFRSGGGQLCLLKAAGEGRENVEQDVRHAVSKAVAMMKNRLKMAYSVSVSGPHEGYAGIRAACREAGEGMEYIALLGRERVVFFRDMKTDHGSPFGISFQRDLELFSQSVSARDTGNAGHVLSRIFKQWIEDCTPSANLIRHRMNGVIGAFIAAMEGLALSYGGDFPQTAPMVDELLQCRNQAELERRIRRMLVELERFARERADRSPELPQRVVRFIQESYGNSGVNVSAIAEAFSVGIPSLSRLFKKQMGIGPLEYLQLVRIGKAKKLLEAGDESLKTIGAKVGFDNEQSFIRVFKKYEGITPGLYRKKAR